MRVQVYFNLHKKVWSVRHKGKVIAHGERLALRDCVCKVNEKARLRVIELKRREVHAWIEGELCEMPVTREGFEAFSYNPYKAAGFVAAEGIFWTAEAVLFEGRLALKKGKV